MTGSTAADVDPGASETLTRDRNELRIRLNRLVEAMSGRTDVILTLIWERPDVTTPAWFSPLTAEITLHGDIALAGAHPADVDPTTVEGLLEHLVVAGLTAHESAHAHSTRWPGAIAPDTPVMVVRAAELLEEARVEAQQLRRRPEDRVLLRAASRHIHLAGRPADATLPEDRWRAASCAALLLARVDAGVLTATEVTPLAALVERALGNSRLNTLRTLWRRALELLDDDGAGLLEVASRWVDAVGIPPDGGATGIGARMPGASCASAAPGADDDQDDIADEVMLSVAAEEPQPSDSDELAALVGDLISEVAADAEQQAVDARSGETPESRAAKAARAAARAHEEQARRDADDHADRVFGHGYRPGRYDTPITGWRAPNGRERAAASRLARELRQARFRERTQTQISSPAPPGRLQGREAMQRAAQRAMGLPPAAKPFRRTLRRPSHNPTLVIGIAVDVSGSMRWAEEPLASAAWIVTNAIQRIGGRAAAVAFGQQVTPVAAPGRPLGQVPELYAGAGTEAFCEAVQALDGALNLAGGVGARLLIAVTDGHLVGPGQITGSAHLLARLSNAGVGVIHLDLGRNTRPLDGAALLTLPDPAASPAAIAAAAVRALKGYRVTHLTRPGSDVPHLEARPADGHFGGQPSPR